jgi:hypothetical protein
MLSLLRQFVRVVTTCVLITVFTVPPGLIGQTHVVSPTELQQETMAAGQTRRHNLETVRQFLSSPSAEKALKSARMNPEKVKEAVSALNDQELAKLASRAEQAQADFAAGHMSDRDLLLILIAIAALILIIIAVR